MPRIGQFILYGQVMCYHIVIQEIKPAVVTLGKTNKLDKNVKQVKKCRICGTTQNLLLNQTFCIDCEEELAYNVKQRQS